MHVFCMFPFKMHVSLAPFLRFPPFWLEKCEKHRKMHVFCMFVWFYLHFEREHAKNMHLFEVFPCFCSSNLEFKNACFLHVQNACQSRSPAPFLEMSTFLAGKVWKTSNKCMFFPCLHDFTCTMHFFEFFPRFCGSMVCFLE